MSEGGFVLVVGHSCLDSVAVLGEAPRPDGKLEALKIWSGTGGPAANAAVALRRLGHRVRLATRIGADAAGSIVDRELRAEGVELLVEPVVGASTSLAQIRALGGERSVVWKRGKLPALPGESRLVEGWLEGAGLLYLDGHEVACGSVLLEAARRRGIPVVADLGSLREGAGDWPASLDAAIATPRWLAQRWPDAVDLAGRLRALAELAGAGALVGVTLGENGGFAMRADELLPWTARKTGAVDTTGAGDAFHAGIADGVVHGREDRECLDLAATLAAAVCRAPGGTASLPADRDQLLLWHGRWGHRTPPTMGLLSGADQGTATR